MTLDEDTTHTFSAADFGFQDADPGDALASLRIAARPAAGTLALGGTPVTDSQEIAAAQLGQLVFAPAANANGAGYASFTFRVSDGTSESALAYTITLDVMAVNDPATGLPTISGTARVGQTLSAEVSAIADAADGLPDPATFTEENWATSVLVKDEIYGSLKTRVAEHWASAKGFDARRIDRRLSAHDRLEHDDPPFALSGVDKIQARRLMAEVGFDCIVDAGLGRTAHDFDRYRVTVFDRARPIDRHFAGQDDAPLARGVPAGRAYRRLEEEIGPCGTAEIGGASVAAPYVSALTAAIAVSRIVAVTSGCECPINEVGKLSLIADRRVAQPIAVWARGLGHAGKPALGAT